MPTPISERRRNSSCLKAAREEARTSEEVTVDSWSRAQWTEAFFALFLLHSTVWGKTHLNCLVVEFEQIWYCYYYCYYYLVLGVLTLAATLATCTCAYSTSQFCRTIIGLRMFGHHHAVLPWLRVQKIATKGFCLRVLNWWPGTCNFYSNSFTVSPSLDTTYWQ